MVELRPRLLESKVSWQDWYSRDVSALTDEAFYGDPVSKTKFRNLSSGIMGKSSADLGIDMAVADEVASHPNPTAREILGYHGISREDYRTKILMSFTGQPKEGSRIIRQAFEISYLHGLDGNFSLTTARTADTFLLIARSIFEYGLVQTNAILERTGLRLFSKYIEKIKATEASLRPPSFHAVNPYCMN